MFIDKYTIEQIKQSIDLVGLLMPYTQLKSVGDKYIGTCPFHKEKTPSFYVFNQTQSYHCFGCGAHGNGISFMMQYENYGYVQALEYFAQKSGIKVKNNAKNKKKVFQNSVQQVLTASLNYFLHHLKEAPKESAVKQYLDKRNFSSKIMHAFEVGYAPQSWDKLLNELIQNHKKDDLIKAGIVKTRNDNSLYDFYRDRLIFPIRNKNDELVGFAGRQIAEDNIPKYINPPDSEHYNKSSLFYGLTQAKEAIRLKKSVIIVEGYTDVMRMHQYDYKETIACCGTSLTQNHIKLLKQFNLEKIYLLFDGDQAGQKAAFRSAKLFLVHALDCQIITLPDHLDPDEILQSNQKESLNIFFEQALHHEQFILNYYQEKTQNNSIQEKNDYINELIMFALEINDSIKIQIWFNRLAQQFGLSLQSIKNKFLQLKNKETVFHQDHSINEREDHFQFLQSDYSTYKIEYIILMDIMNHPEIFSLVKKIIKPDHFQSKNIKSFFSRIYQFDIDEFQSLNITKMIELFPEFSQLIHFILQLSTYKYDIEFDYNFFKHRLMEFLEKSIYAQYKILFHNTHDSENQERLYLQRKKELNDLALLNLDS